MKLPELRFYQESILNTCAENDTLVVLPTGTGKTFIALSLALLRKDAGKIMFLAPTKPLVSQHLGIFKDYFPEDETSVLTGSVNPAQREEIYAQKKIIFATPQTIENDIVTRKLNFSDYSLIIFDECLTADAKVLLSTGQFKEISLLVEDFYKGKTIYVKSFDEANNAFINGQVAGAQKIPCFKKIVEISLENTKVKSTEDHLFLAKRDKKMQWIKACELKLSDELAYSPFNELNAEFNKEIILEDDVIKTYSKEQQKNIELYNSVISLRRKYKRGERKISKELHFPNNNVRNWIYSKIKPFPLTTLDEMKKINLLPFSYNNPVARIISRIIGYIFGDGWFYKNKCGYIAGFSGSVENLNLIQEDLKLLGLKYSKITSRKTHSKVNGADIDGTTNSFTCCDKRLTRLLACLGVPHGKKVIQEFRVPQWIMESPDEIKKEFLASLFGCEMNLPAEKKNSCSFNPIRFSFYKLDSLHNNALDYANDLKGLLKEFNVEVSSVKKLEGNLWKDGKTKTNKYLLTLSNSNKNFINFFSNVSYAYNTKKENKALAALQYLLKKEELNSDLTKKYTQAIELKKEGFNNKLIADMLDLPIWRLEQMIKNKPANKMTPTSFIKYSEWENHNKDNILWEKIKSLGYSKDEDYVYDLTVEKTHNFIANNIVVHNCHRAIGDYAYVFLAEQYAKQSKNPRILGLSASPGHDISKIKEVMQNLNLKKIETRTEKDSDIKKYIKQKKVKKIVVDFPAELDEIKSAFNTLLKKHVNHLRFLEYLSTSDISKIRKKTMLFLQSKIRTALNREKNRTLFEAMIHVSACIKLLHALELLQTQGPKSVLDYLMKLKLQAKKTKSAKEITETNEFKKSLALADELVSKNIKHPKFPELNKIVTSCLENSQSPKIIIFTQYRDTARQIQNELGSSLKCASALFLGQKEGMTQKKQAEIIEDFKNGKYNTLVCTSVAEEGIHVENCDVGIFFEPIPSALRMIQRRGRIGRTNMGEIYVMMTKGCIDERYFWVAKHKEERMRLSIQNLSNSEVFDDG